MDAAKQKALRASLARLEAKHRQNRALAPGMDGKATSALAQAWQWSANAVRPAIVSRYQE
jgi:hypothetical protein